MRFEVTIPDSLYGRAQNAAAASGLSIESFVVEAVQYHVKEGKRQKLSPEQILAVQNAQAEIKSGKYLTTERLKQELHENRTEWQKENGR